MTATDNVNKNIRHSYQRENTQTIIVRHYKISTLATSEHYGYQVMLLLIATTFSHCFVTSSCKGAINRPHFAREPQPKAFELYIP